MNSKARRTSGAEVVTKDDFWPTVVEFLLSQKAWWIGLCEELGLTPMQGHTLRLLDPERPVAMSALADGLTCDASNVTGLVDKLESRGLVVRQAGHDRRVKMLAVTEEGRRLREQLSARMMEPPAAVALLSPADCRRLAGFLRAVVDERSAAARPGRKVAG